MSKRWRIYCTEPGDEGFKYIWSDTAPTECPNNATHSVNSNSVKQDMKEVSLLKISPSVRKLRSKNLEVVGICNFNPDDFPGTLRRVKILAYLDTGATSYDFEVYDRDNNTSLTSSNFTNMNNKYEEMETGVISSSPSAKTVLEFNLKKTGGSNKKFVRVEEISLFFGVRI